MRETKWSTSALAKRCGVSVRTLERHFLKEMNKSPKAWILEQRLLEAVELLRDGRSVKETAEYLGYKHATHFSREFMKQCGHHATDAKSSSQAGGVRMA